MLNSVRTDKKCERCGEPVDATSAFDDYGPASWESCSKLCYHWFDYGFARYKPEGITDYRDLTGVLGQAAPQGVRLAELEEKQTRTGIIDPELVDKSFRSVWLDTMGDSQYSCDDCGAVVLGKSKAKHYAWHRGRTVD